MGNTPRTYHSARATKRPRSARPRRPRRRIGIVIAIALGLTIAIVATRPSEDRPAASLGTAVEAGDSVTGSVTPDGEVDAADGVLSAPASPFDLHIPAIANLDADLLRAVQAAASTAWTQGVPFSVTSGWRSPEYQQQLLNEAIVDYGSEEEARRWVATPETSAHVSGDAVDIGPTDANSWLSQRGAHFGLCQTYSNETWHFELATTPGGECPPLQADAAP
ncbi:MAG: peptidase M15 [Dehalococcoidia bacterium]|nr:peptidase M15 [Dehalococcoidia bacterium]